LTPAPARAGSQFMLDLLDSKRVSLGGKLVQVDQAGFFDVTFSSAELQRFGPATYAAALYQGHADLPAGGPSLSADASPPARAQTALLRDGAFAASVGVASAV